MIDHSSKFIEYPAGYRPQDMYREHSNWCRSLGSPFIQVRTLDGGRSATVEWDCDAIPIRHEAFMSEHEHLISRTQLALVALYVDLSGDATPMTRFGLTGWISCLPLADARHIARMIYDMLMLAVGVAKRD